MKVIHIQEVLGRMVEVDGVREVQMRVPFPGADGPASFTVRFLELAPLGFTGLHTHAWEQEIIVWAGDGTLRARGETKRLEQGVVALIEAGEEHQFRAGPQGLGYFSITPAGATQPTD
jgi:quercetin dioxygenase-like cupin family protein